ncbi:MAG: NIPSNAP family protein [Acidobacteria bacterium]|nr:NIPSNAP family protein [Acidobacteriota bacterium]
MQRRSFLEITGALSAGLGNAQAAPTAVPRYFVLEQYFLKNGTQGARLAAYLQAGPLETAHRLRIPGPLAVLEALVAPHMPQIACVTAFASLDEMMETRKKRSEDDKFRAALAEWEKGDEAPYEHFSESLLEAAPYQPPLIQNLMYREQPRVFELRVYHSPTERQLKLLHERFAGPEIQIFHRCGIRPVLYSSTLIGPQKPNLVYLTPFDNLAAREKAWAAFGADPEWVKVRAESIAKGGQISSVSQISLFKAAAYSPMR